MNIYQANSTFPFNNHAILILIAHSYEFYYCHIISRWRRGSFHTRLDVSNNIINSWRAICQIKLPGGHARQPVVSVGAFRVCVIERCDSEREWKRVGAARARVDYMHDGDGESIKAKRERERGRKGSSNGAYKRDIHPLSLYIYGSHPSQRQRQPKSEWGEDKKEHQKHKRLLMSS